MSSIVCTIYLIVSILLDNFYLPILTFLNFSCNKYSSDTSARALLMEVLRMLESQGRLQTTLLSALLDLHLQKLQIQDDLLHLQQSYESLQISYRELCSFIIRRMDLTDII